MPARLSTAVPRRTITLLSGRMVEETRRDLDRMRTASSTGMRRPDAEQVGQHPDARPFGVAHA